MSTPEPAGQPSPPSQLPTEASGAADDTSASQAATKPVVPHHRHHAEANPRGRRLAILSLTALGVVYGDIGTSPLYAIRECFNGEHGIAATVANVYGVLSLIVWALILVVSIKYLVFVMRADNRGEGGTFALLALLLQKKQPGEGFGGRMLLIALGLFGASLLFGEGIITPAMSVLSAVEGLEIATPGLSHFVIPITVTILFILFVFQKHGTARVGSVFGPVMLLWFATIATLGVLEIAREPQILLAVNPWYGVRFFLDNGVIAFLILGAVVLVITGAEALYADMGHFGKRPIRLAWFVYVLPCLLLNYFGQGALLLRTPEAAVNPFYLLAPRSLLIPMIVLATFAAIIASQALISGAFSIMQQGMQLGYTPRLTIVHTSARQVGQIYIPEINWTLMVACLLLVVTFRSSSNLAAAYGIAVTGTMAITSALFFVVARTHWHWPLLATAGLTGLFLAVDLSFFGANGIKVAQGGWVPLAIAAVMFTMLTTWKKGRKLLYDILSRAMLPLDQFLDDVEQTRPVRVPGTAVFMTSTGQGTPIVLLHHLKHNKVLHEQVVLLSVITAEVPEVAADERIEIERLSQGFFRVQAAYGFMETPNVPAVLQYCGKHGINVKKTDVSYYLG
ncbi:MAG: potassium transporter Kup, partial [Gemmatimonadaceae bacterium]